MTRNKISAVISVTLLAITSRLLVSIAEPRVDGQVDFLLVVTAWLLTLTILALVKLIEVFFFKSNSYLTFPLAAVFLGIAQIVLAILVKWGIL